MDGAESNFLPEEEVRKVTEPHKAKEVPEQLDKLGMLLKELDESTHSLEEQLKPVLCTESVQQSEQSEQEKKEVQQLVPLADLLRERCNRAESILFRINYLRQRLQI